MDSKRNWSGDYCMNWHFFQFVCVANDNLRGAQSANKSAEGSMMMDMSAMGTSVLVAMGIYHLAIFLFAVLGTAASIKYLRS